MLTETQQRFLVRYQDSKGDVYGSLKSLGLELNHLMSWRTDKEFEKNYKDVQKSIILFLNTENYVQGLRELNTQLLGGQKQETVTHCHKIGSDGSHFEVKRTVKELKVSADLIRLAISQNTIVQAINTLVTQGIIPDSIARKILNKSDEIAKEMEEAFNNDSGGEQMNQQKAIKLIKQAFLKGTEE